MPDNQFSLGHLLSSLIKLAGLYLLVLLFAAVLTPVVFSMLHPLNGKFGFERIFDRLRYLGLLPCLPLIWNWAALRAGTVGWISLGWGRRKSALALLVLGAASVLLLGVVLTNGLDRAVFPENLPAVIGMGIVSALVICLLEEIIFRGILQNYLSQNAGTCLGIMAASLLYAFLHGRPVADGMEFQGWTGSFALVGLYLSGAPSNLAPIVFVNLALLGIALGIFYTRSRSLLLPMGLHFGIVAAAMPVAAILRANDISSMDLLGGAYTTFMLMGWIILAIIWPMRPVQPE